jgi:predicted nucleic acid-binding protein
MSGERVLIDTSVWIAFFRNTSPELSEKVDDLISNAEVYVPQIVIAELIQGARSDREISTIESLVDAFTIVGQTENSWAKAGKLAYSLKKRGKTVNLADCYIAVIAKEQGCKIYTLDVHFKDIQKIARIQLL